MFHVKDGLYFERLDCGAVRMTITEEPLVGSPVAVEHIIDPSVWASIVSTVSTLGESSATYEMAKAMQQGFCTAQKEVCEICKQGPK